MDTSQSATSGQHQDFPAVGGSLLRALSTLAIGCGLFVVLALTVLHLLRPELSPMSRPMSNYALGPGRWLFTAAMLCVPIMMISLALSLHGTFLHPVIRSWRGVLPAAIAAAAFLLMTFARKSSTANEDILTRTDQLHVIGATVGMLWVHIVMVRMSLHFRTEPAWRALGHRFMTITCLAWLTFLPTLSILPGCSFLRIPAAMGLLQRVNVASMLLWALLVAAHIRHMTGQRA